MAFLKLRLDFILSVVFTLLAIFCIYGIGQIVATFNLYSPLLGSAGLALPIIRIVLYCFAWHLKHIILAIEREYTRAIPSLSFVLNGSAGISYYGVQVTRVYYRRSVKIIQLSFRIAIVTFRRIIFACCLNNQDSHQKIGVIRGAGSPNIYFTGKKYFIFCPPKNY